MAEEESCIEGDVFLAASQECAEESCKAVNNTHITGNLQGQNTNESLRSDPVSEKKLLSDLLCTKLHNVVATKQLK